MKMKSRFAIKVPNLIYFVLAVSIFFVGVLQQVQAATPSNKSQSVTSSPVLLSPINNSSSTLAPTLNWGSVTKASNYQVQVTTVTDTTYSSPVINITTLATSVSLPALSPSSYRWHVRGQNKYGYGPWSSDWLFSIISQPSANTTPTSVPSIQPSPTSNPTPTPTPPDTTLPIISIDMPVNGATISGQFDLVGKANDNVGITKVEVSIDSGSFQTATGTVDWTSPLNTFLYSNGNHTLVARVTDSSGNIQTASVTFSINNIANPANPPDTQGTWVSPEGVTIEVNSMGNWTIAQIYNMLKPSALELGMIGPSLTINVQDGYPSQTVTSVNQVGGVYSGFRATVYLKGVNSTFASQPEAQLAHEYGHVWTLYHLYMTQHENWTPYLSTRWSSANGSLVLGQDSRLDSTYTWSTMEIIADDYRLLFGSAVATSERPMHMNTSIVDPRNQSGLRDWFINVWGK